MIKNYLPFILFGFLLFTGCGRTDDESIKREIKIREARRGHDLVTLDVNYHKNASDTFAVYYKASVKVHEKDSTITDSLFFVNQNGALLPFITSKQ